MAHLHTHFLACTAIVVGRFGSVNLCIAIFTIIIGLTLVKANGIVGPLPSVVVFDGVQGKVPVHCVVGVRCPTAFVGFVRLLLIRCERASVFMTVRRLVAVVRSPLR